MIDMSEIGQIESIVIGGDSPMVYELTAGCNVATDWLKAMSQPIEVYFALDQPVEGFKLENTVSRVQVFGKDGELLLDRDAKSIKVDESTGEVKTSSPQRKGRKIAALEIGKGEGPSLTV